MRHYEFAGEHWAKTKGYEYYAAMGSAPRTPEMDDFFLNLQIWGTPEQCYERVMKIRADGGAGALRRRVLVRRHAVRRGRGERATVLARGDAGAQARGRGDARGRGVLNDAPTAS